MILEYKRSDDIGLMLSDLKIHQNYISSYYNNMLFAILHQNMLPRHHTYIIDMNDETIGIRYATDIEKELLSIKYEQGDSLNKEDNQWILYSYRNNVKRCEVSDTIVRLLIEDYDETKIFYYL